MKDYHPAAPDFDYHLIMGNLLMRFPMVTKRSATDCFRHAIEMRPDNEQALSGYARSSFRYHNYEAALNAYNHLIDLKPGHRGYMLNAAICLANMERADEALKLLYRLDYEQPDDMKVKRVLAWVQTTSGRYDQANKNYDQLMAVESPLAVDMLNYGYCLWFQGQISEAINHFRQFLLSSPDGEYDMEKEFMQSEHAILAAHNISDLEIQLMLDALS